jgi:hypothetical protein
LNNEYRISSPDFHCVSQLRSVKQLQLIQTSLDQTRDSLTTLKFQGNVDIDPVKATTELDKNHFLKRLERLVDTYGFQGFFYMRSTTDGNMVSLLSHSHLFTLKEVIEEHRSRQESHVPIYDSNGNETVESLTAAYGKYDAYDRLDCRISRLAVESIIGHSLQEDIETRYSHLHDFHSLPGNVYFMMALEASNASVSLDIDDDAEKFNSLALSSYPGENVKGLATEALRLIKVMQGGYYLPLRLGSDLLRKVSSTSCEHFNRWIHSKLDEVRELELKYKLKDPKLMAGDPDYSSLGPVALCGFLQEKYGSLIMEKAWPALSATLPVSNNIIVTPGGPSLDVLKTPRVRCNYCKAPGHDKTECPKLAAKRNRNKDSDADPPLTPAPAPTPSPKPAPAPLAGWRYMQPADPTLVLEVDGVKYKWCKECRCRASGKQGYFTTTHFSSEHMSKPPVTFAANHSSLPLVSQLGDGFTPDSIPEEERLVFTGPWHCAVELESSVTIEVDPVVVTGEEVVCPDASDSCVPPSHLSFWMSEIPNLPVDDGVESITFTYDEETPIAAATSAIDVRNSVVPCVTTLGPLEQPSDEPVVATPILQRLPNPTLLVDTMYSCIFDTRPLLSVIDLNAEELYSCDNAPCLSCGPGGFNCLSCDVGLYNTPMVKCSHCEIGTGFLGDQCSSCLCVLYGEHILMQGLPGQRLIDYTDTDEDDSLICRNSSRNRYLFTGSGFVPFPSVYCSPCFVPWEPTPFLPNVALDRITKAETKQNNLDEDVFYETRDEHEDDDLTPDSSINIVEDLEKDSMLGWWLVLYLTDWSTVRLVLKTGIKGLSFSWKYGKSTALQGIGICSSCISLFTKVGSFWLFFWSTIGWDTLELFLTQPSHTSGSRRRTRSRWRSTLRIFPRHWMILSSLMMLGGFRSLTGFSASMNPLYQTYARCLQLSTLVHMSPIVVRDLFMYRYRNLFQEPSHDAVGSPVWRSSHESKDSATIDQSFVPGGGGNASATDDLSTQFYDALESIPSLDLFHLDPVCCSSSMEINCIETGTLDHCSPSRPGLNAALSGINFLYELTPSSVPRFPVIFDSGASIAITGDKTDFVGPLTAPPSGLTIGGMARGATVEGIGVVKWKFKTPSGSMTLSVVCYYVPACSARLLSPQRLFKKSKGIDGSFSIREEHAILTINDNPPLVLDYEETTFLPVGLAWNATQSQNIIHPSVNLCVTSEENQNLTQAQKLLLSWHYRFGHRNLPFVQHLLRLPVFNSEKFLAAAKADIPKCEICEYAKGHARSTSGNRHVTNPTTDGVLKDGHLRPGSKVSADHFESRMRGRTYSSHGKTTSDQYVGGCIFVDHMSGYMHVEHQLGFSSSETIRAKQNFEQVALGYGVLVEDYLTDNGIFSRTKFVDHIRQHNQQIHYCGVNAHHKNAIAERAIRTVSELSHALLLHASAHWPDGLDGTLWPMAVDHAVYLYNTLPNRHGICPADLFTGSTIPRHKLRELHVWGCPVYVLDPTLQQGKKLPRWQPRSRRGVFLGYSPHHSSDVPLVLNLQTGSISPQFHVVFDDTFSTVSSLAVDSAPPDFWTAANLESCIYRVPVDPDDPSCSLLPDDWLTPHELEEKRRNTYRRSQIRSSYLPEPSQQSPLTEPPSHQSPLTHVVTTQDPNPNVSTKFVAVSQYIWYEIKVN